MTTVAHTPAPPASRAQAVRMLDALTADRDTWRDRAAALAACLDTLRGHADRMYQLGVKTGRREAAGYCENHAQQIADAYLAGQRSAAASPSDFDAGFDACWRRFAAEIGSRSMPRRRRRDPDKLSPRALARARKAWEDGREERAARVRASWDAGSRP
jgi:hypothetical protein